MFRTERYCKACTANSTDVRWRRRVVQEGIGGLSRRVCYCNDAVLNSVLTAPNNFFTVCPKQSRCETLDTSERRQKRGRTLAHISSSSAAPCT